MDSGTPIRQPTTYEQHDRVIPVYPEYLTCPAGRGPRLILPDVDRFDFQVKDTNGGLDLSRAFARIDGEKIPVEGSGDVISVSLMGITKGFHKFNLFIPADYGPPAGEMFNFWWGCRIPGAQLGIGADGVLLVNTPVGIPETVLEKLNNWTLNSTPWGDMPPVEAGLHPVLNVPYFSFGQDFNDLVNHTPTELTETHLNFSFKGHELNIPFIPSYITNRARQGEMDRTAQGCAYGCQKGTVHPLGTSFTADDWTEDRLWGVYGGISTDPMNDGEDHAIANWEYNPYDENDPPAQPWYMCSLWVVLRFSADLCAKGNPGDYPNHEADPLDYNWTPGYYWQTFWGDRALYYLNRGVKWIDPRLELRVDCHNCCAEDPYGAESKGHRFYDTIPGDITPPEFDELLVIDPEYLQEFYDNEWLPKINTAAENDPWRIWDGTGGWGAADLEDHFNQHILPLAENDNIVGFLAVHAKDVDPSGYQGKILSMFLSIDLYDNESIVSVNDIPQFCHVDLPPVVEDEHDDQFWPVIGPPGVVFDPENPYYLTDGEHSCEDVYWLIPIFCGDIFHEDIRVRLNDEWNWRRSGGLVTDFHGSQIGDTQYGFNGIEQLYSHEVLGMKLGVDWDTELQQVKAPTEHHNVHNEYTMCGDDADAIIRRPDGVAAVCPILVVKYESCGPPPFIKVTVRTSEDSEKLPAGEPGLLTICLYRVPDGNDDYAGYDDDDELYQMFMTVLWDNGYQGMAPRDIDLLNHNIAFYKRGETLLYPTSPANDEFIIINERLLQISDSQLTFAPGDPLPYIFNGNLQALCSNPEFANCDLCVSKPILYCSSNDDLLPIDYRLDYAGVTAFFGGIFPDNYFSTNITIDNFDERRGHGWQGKCHGFEDDIWFGHKNMIWNGGIEKLKVEYKDKFDCTLVIQSESNVLIISSHGDPIGTGYLEEFASGYNNIWPQDPGLERCFQHVDVSAGNFFDWNGRDLKCLVFNSCDEMAHWEDWQTRGATGDLFPRDLWFNALINTIEADQSILSISGYTIDISSHIFAEQALLNIYAQRLDELRLGCHIDRYEDYWSGGKVPKDEETLKPIPDPSAQAWVEAHCIYLESLMQSIRSDNQYLFCVSVDRDHSYCIYPVNGLDMSNKYVTNVNYHLLYGSIRMLGALESLPLLNVNVSASYAD